MRLVQPLAALVLVACGGRTPSPSPPTAPPGVAPATSTTSAQARATKDRVLLVAGTHGIQDARWTDHRIVARSESEVWFVDPEHPSTTHLFETEAPIAALVTDSVSPLAAVRLQNDQVLTFLRGALLRRLTLEATERVETVSPDGRWLLIGTPASERMSVVDARTGERVSTFAHEDGLAVFDPTGAYVLRAASLVRVTDGAIVKTWRTSETAQFAPRGWVSNRAVIFHEKGIRLVDPVTTTVKEVPFECRPNTAPHDVFAPAVGLLMHLCGERAMLVDPETGGITRVKVPVASTFQAFDSKVLADGTVSISGSQTESKGAGARIVLAFDRTKLAGTVVDREPWSEGGVVMNEAPGPTFEDRECVRSVGKVLAGYEAWCSGERDGALVLSVAGGSMAIAKADGELARYGARIPGGTWTPYRLVGGAGVGGMLESPDADGTTPGIRWKLGEPSVGGTRKLDVAGRRCGLGTELSNGHVIAMCEASPTSATPERRKPKKGGYTSVLVELSASLEILAERDLPDAGAVVVANGHPITWMPRSAPPMRATEWAGTPTTCGADCAALAALYVYRDFALRVDGAGKMQIAGAPDLHALACIDEHGLVRAYDACPANAPLVR